jgi:formate/nitrite transporter FocA (FNT family)
MNKIMTKNTHKIWLKVTAISIFGYAVLFFLGTIKNFCKPIEFILDFSSFPLDRFQNYDAPTTVFLSALLGGILFGWGMMILLLSIKLYDKSPEQVRQIVLISLLSWFIVDSIGSTFSGNVNNVVTNIGLLLLLVGPLWMPAKEEKEK